MLLPLATQVALNIPPDALMGAVFLAGLSFIISSVAGVASIWDKFRRKPPADQTFLTKDEGKAMEDRLTKAIEDNREAHRATEEAVFHRINEVDSTLATGLKDVARSIGQLEGGNRVAQAIETAITRLVENCAMKQRMWESRRGGVEG